MRRPGLCTQARLRARRGAGVLNMHEKPTARQYLMKYSPATCLFPHVTPEVTNYPEEVPGSFVDLDGFAVQHPVIRHRTSLAISAVIPAQGATECKLHSDVFNKKRSKTDYYKAKGA